MVYILVHKNQVVNGPRLWSYYSFQSTLADELRIEASLPVQKDDDTVFVVDENTKIMPAQLNWIQHNPKIEYLDGPFWDFSNDIAIGQYEKKTYSVDTVKIKLKQTVAENRWNSENSKIAVVVQGAEVTVSIARNDRAVFDQQYMSMADDDVVLWKFPEQWVTLSKTDVQLIATTIRDKVQEKFLWEMNKCAEIDQCTSVEQLDQVELIPPVV